MKRSVDEHMLFVDLPITQILLGGCSAADSLVDGCTCSSAGACSSSGGACSSVAIDRVMYFTRLAQFAIEHKLNIVTADSISNKSSQTLNRMVKYAGRGFYTAVHSLGELKCLANPGSRISSIFDDTYMRYYVDMSLEDVVDAIHVLLTPELYEEIPRELPSWRSRNVNNGAGIQTIECQENRGQISTPIFHVLHHRGVVQKSVSTTTVETTKRRTYFIHRVQRRGSRYRGYRGRRFMYDSSSDDYDTSDDEYEQVVENYKEVLNTTTTKFATHRLRRYAYKHDESMDIFANLHSRSEYLQSEESNGSIRSNFPLYVPMPICQLRQCRKLRTMPLFFSSYNDYFLNKSGCGRDFDGTYCDYKFVQPIVRDESAFCACACDSTCTCAWADFEESVFEFDPLLEYEDAIDSQLTNRSFYRGKNKKKLPRFKK